MSSPVRTTTLGELGLAEAPPEPLTLLVVAPEGVCSYVLPEPGALEIGRRESVDVRLEDPSASRNHARLHVGADQSLTIEDLGSSNGTFVRGEPAPAGTRVAIAPGETVTIGSTLLVVQKPGRNPRSPVRVWAHFHFEARLGEACRTAGSNHEELALLRAHFDADVTNARVVAAIRPLMQWGDAVAAYAPNEYELLVTGRGRGNLAAACAQLREALAGCAPARFGLARFPADGRSADALMWRASEALRGEGPSPSADEALVLSPVMQELYQVARRAASAPSNLLILGETGAGKDVLARTLHRASPRADRPFLALNCAGLNENLLESELFGHERGAFTGALAAKPGLLESADGGTLFLDEVGELPPTVQAKLLRVLETREVRRLGALKTRPLDLRILAATNRKLDEEVASGRFRQDLYFRLAALVLEVPPLRERRSEILPLSRRFLSELSGQHGRRHPPRLSPDAAAWLEAYAWPGNIRELKNAMERALILCAGDEIQIKHLPFAKLEGKLDAKLDAKLAGALEGEPDLASAYQTDKVPAPPLDGRLASGPPPLPRAETPGPTAPVRPGPPAFQGPDAQPEDAAGDDERRAIVAALAKAGGNQKRAAQLVGMPLRTFVRRLKA